MRCQSFLGLFVSVMLVALAGPAVADPLGSGAAPPPAQLVEATNAMLRPADVPAVLKQVQPGRWSGFNTGYTNSFVNEDPAPVCSSPGGLSVFPAMAGAIVFRQPAPMSHNVSLSIRARVRLASGTPQKCLA